MASTEAEQRTDVGPEDIPKPGWVAILKRTVKGFQNDNLTDWAAALTYYAVLALFPALIALVVSGPLAEAIGKQIGLGGTAVTVWNIAKWPVLAFVVSLMLAVLYYAAPNARLPKFQWLSPGAIVAVVVWVVASFGFFLYAKNFGSYDKTYGTLGAAITLL